MVTGKDPGSGSTMHFSTLSSSRGVITQNKGSASPDASFGDCKVTHIQISARICDMR